MKLLVISQYYYPEQFKINEICESLVEKGHSVKVITGLPNYPTGKIFDNYKNHKNRKEIINGVSIDRCFLFARGNGKFGLALNYLSFMITASLKSMFIKDKYDLVLVYQLSPILMAIPGIVYKRKHGIPLYLYCLDLWPESLKVNIRNEENFVYKYFKKVSTKIYQSCDMIGITSKPFKQYLKEVHSIDENKVIYLPQHGHDIFKEINRIRDTSEVINISYFGNIGKAQDFDMIIRNIDKINQNIVFNIVGSGSEYENLRDKVGNKGLNNRIILHGYKQKPELLSLYSQTDICFLTLKSNSLIDKTLPAKMIEYLSTNKPIIAIAEGAVKEVIEQAECGYCIGFEDDDELVDKINLLSTNSELRDKLGMNGRAYFKASFTKGKFIINLEMHLLNLMGEKKDV